MYLCKRMSLVLAALYLYVGMAMAQTTISGTVFSADDNEPLMGANILVEGTQKRAITDLDGKFTLSDVKSNAVLVVSMIGMRTEKVKARMEAIKAETERLRKEVGSMLEPTGQIKNSIISKQDRLISRIYNPKSADDETRKLKDEIDKDMKRLKNRKVF